MVVTVRVTGRCPVIVMVVVVVTVCVTGHCPIIVVVVVVVTVHKMYIYVIIIVSSDNKSNIIKNLPDVSQAIFAVIGCYDGGGSCMHSKCCK